MKRKDHPSIVEARRELLRNGYWPLHANDGFAKYGEPRGKRRFAIRREDRPRSTVFHIIEIEKEAS